MQNTKMSRKKSMIKIEDSDYHRVPSINHRLSVISPFKEGEIKSNRKVTF